MKYVEEHIITPPYIPFGASKGKNIIFEIAR